MASLIPVATRRCKGWAVEPSPSSTWDLVLVVAANPALMFPGPRCQPHRSRGVLPCPSPACCHSDRIATSLGDCISEHTVSLYGPPRLVGRTLPVEDGLVDDGTLVPAPSVSREGAVYSVSPGETLPQTVLSNPVGPSEDCSPSLSTSG